MSLLERLRQRLAEVEGRIANACRRSGRAREDVTLVAVTKTVSPEIAALLPELGIEDLGESRPQELWRKAAHLPNVRWHLIGHLQRNKIEQSLPLVHMIHSVDSVRLLEALEQEARRRERKLPVLLEVNASREPQKHGVALGEVSGLVDQLGKPQFVEVRGLMTMAALNADEVQCRATFAELRELRDRLHFPLPHQVEHLSMGMSNDFEIAIEEGATFVRLGSVLFEGIEP